MVEAEAMLADLAIDHHIVKCVDVAGGLPDQRVHHNRGVEGYHIVAQLDRVAPPCGFYVALEHGTERTVIPESVDSTVDLARLKDEASALGQRRDLLHRDALRRGGRLHRS